MADEKVRFASDAWLAALRRGLSKLAEESGAALEGVSVRILEIVTNAPADMADPARPDGSRAWHIVIDGGRAYADWGEIADADFGSISDYDAILTLARWVYTDDEADQAAVEAHRQDLVIRGMFRPLGEPPDLAPTIAGRLRELHNGLARITA
ncbi:MAG: hypothetical protein JWO83_2116 [Caulobacteraceae bacterium]|jgi:hypothetical protein|nr:hypothetical protein [Caulobacteraceae bacterium]